MRKLFELLTLAIIAVACILPSCTKDNFDMDRLSGEVKYDGSFAIPLAYGDIAFYQVLDLLDTTIALQDNDEGYLSMFYHSYVESKKVQDLLNLKEKQAFSLSVPFSEMAARGVRAGTQFYYSTEEKISFTLMNEEIQNDEAEIDSLALNSATLEYSLTSTFGLASKFVIEFPSIRKNGMPLKDSISLYSTDMNDHKVLSLAGYTIDMTTTDRHFNEIPVKVSMLLDCSTPPTMGNFDINVSFRDFNYKGMYGYFGYNELLIQSDTIEITMFKENPKYDWEHASFYFKKPRLTVTYWNSYGVPAEFYFTELNTYMRRTDVIEDMSFIAKPNFPLSENNPFVLHHSVRPGFEAEGSVTVDSSNSHLDQIIPNRPSWIHFCAKAVTNNTPVHTRNFIDENSKVRSKIEVEIPLYGFLYNFTYRDTADIDISSYVGNLPIKRMALNMNIKNNMPVAAKAQFYLVDENYNVLDSLIKNTDEMILRAAEVDAYGHLLNNELVSTPTRIELTREQIEHLSDSRHILIKITTNTAGQAQSGEEVKLFRNYGFKLNIGLDVDLDVEGNINAN